MAVQFFVFQVGDRYVEGLIAKSVLQKFLIGKEVFLMVVRVKDK